jgi:C_GCAxxG_C_C family probable redox protein
MTRAENAAALQASGSACSQAVFCVFAEEFGLDQESAHKIATGLGAGFGRQQRLCGALSGAALVLGLAMGNRRGEEAEDKESCYAAVSAFIDEMEAEFGAADCRGLLEGLDLRDPAGKAAIAERGLSARVCKPIVRRCVERLEEILGLGRPEKLEDKAGPPAGLSIREAHAADAALLARFRYRMFVDMHPESDYRGIEEALVKGSEDYHRRRVVDPEYAAFIAEAGGLPIGCAVLLVEEKPPHAKRLQNLSGYVLSVFVETEFRGRGVAKALMEAIRQEAAGRGVLRLSLHASRFGKPLYRSLGYRPNPDYLELGLESAGPIPHTRVL